MSHTGPAGVDPESPTPPTGPPPPLEEIDSEGEIAANTMVGEFRIESRLGKGGMATVYSAVQPLIGKRAAIKVMSRALCSDERAVGRFVQEARAVNQIGHPNIVDAFAFGTLSDGRSYIVMEWLPGETLAQRVANGPLGIAEAIAIIFQICDGLAAAHDKGIVHRDLKPENVFLVPVRNRRLLVKLLDFGIAKLRGPLHDPNVSHTAPGKTIGTPRYMSPEQARGKEVDYRADVYALGVTAYEMFTGRVPFLGEEAVDVMHQHVHAMPPAPSTLRPDLPLQIERLLLQMLEKKPDKRPTLMQIEARLADVRDRLSLSGPAQIVSDVDPARPVASKHVVTPPRIAATDSVDALKPASGLRRMFVGGALVACGVGLLVGLAVARRHPAAPDERAIVAPVPPPAPAQPQPTAPRPATLVLTVNVPNAAVKLDGEMLADSTPGGLFSVDKTGTHRLVVSAARRKSVERTITLSAGEETRVDVELERLAPVRAEAPPPAVRAARPRNRDDMINPFSGR